IAEHEVNLEPKLFAPDRSAELGAVYLPVGGGVEFVSLVAQAAGQYTLEIRTHENGAKAGRYEVVIKELHLATEQEKDYLAAERVESEGRTLLHSEGLLTVERSRQVIAKYEEALTLWRKLGDRKGEF